VGLTRRPDRFAAFLRQGREREVAAGRPPKAHRPKGLRFRRRHLPGAAERAATQLKTRRSAAA
jgi:hypothetical protein